MEPLRDPCWDSTHDSLRPTSGGESRPHPLSALSLPGFRSQLTSVAGSPVHPPAPTRPNQPEGLLPRASRCPEDAGPRVGGIDVSWSRSRAQVGGVTTVHRRPGRPYPGPDGVEYQGHRQSSLKTSTPPLSPFRLSSAHVHLSCRRTLAPRRSRAGPRGVCRPWVLPLRSDMKLPSKDIQ